MKESVKQKLQTLVERHEEIAALLSDSSVIGDAKQFRFLSKEYADLQPVVDCYNAHLSTVDTIEQAKVLLNDEDREMRELAKEDLLQAQSEQTAIEQQLQTLLLPKDPNDARDVFLEIRAGTGGDEAAIFSGDLCRMYMRFAEIKSWRTEMISANQGEHGGYKEVILKISGLKVYSQLKFESGAHRVQRVPATESQGRIHTSACTVAIIAEVDEIDEVAINPSDLKIDTYRASGAGGQHVNKTDSAIRITHLPTGIVIECQEDRSQHKNRARAMSLLQSRILAEQQAAQQAEIAQNRRNLVGSGDRSERIRTYNYPQGRVTDHRINLTLYKLAEVMEGELGSIIDPLVQEHQMDLLAALGDSEN